MTWGVALQVLFGVGPALICLVLGHCVGVLCERARWAQLFVEHGDALPTSDVRNILIYGWRKAGRLKAQTRKGGPQ